ncbi:hypothetical protein R9X49_20425 [Pectobacterium carotovorum]|uniref:hypothetical protein n=1 Tax=Pectobacterium carotovorum TaxID=554 RepID=UPI0029D79BBA|nr:hypothetical protein [Pectobacterium carotovorum]MDX6917478.1 hypothetical protein [Pectobacterium carotovorum]
MADIFSLAPEGLAWTDNAAQNKAARPEDYEPGFMAGSISALPRGIAEGAIGVLQSSVAADQKLISDPKYLQEFIPTYGAFKALFPDADQRITEAYDSTSKALERAREYIKPEPGTQGTAAQVLDGLGQFVPAMAVSVFAGPAAGGATAFGSTYEPSRQEFLSKGVDPETASTLALEQGTANAAGMALPAGVGGRLLTRLASGVGINTGFGAASRFAVSDTLEDNGYSDLAKQYQAWDKQALLVDGVLGAAFGGLHHWTAGRETGRTDSDILPPDEQQAISTDNQINNIEQPVTTEISPIEQQPSPPQVVHDSVAEPTYESRITELQNMSGQLMSRGDRKVWQSEIANSERVIARLEAEDKAIRDAAPTGSTGANRRYYEANQDKLDEISSQLDGARQRLQEAQKTLAPHQPNGQFYEAKADLSRLEQGIIPESMRGLVREADIRPSDVDAAHAMNEGLNYDIESAPVAHGSIESVNAHVAAMDRAAAQLMRGESVNVVQQVRGLDGVVKPGAIEQGQQQRTAMEEAYKENGISYSQPREELTQAPELRQKSTFSGVGEDGTGQVSTDPDTGAVISSNSYDLMAARDMSQSNPELNILHPDTGEIVPLSKALADMDEQIATVQKESRVYSVAAACFLRNS